MVTVLPAFAETEGEKVALTAEQGLTSVYRTAV
jgi:hypothetical protein